MIMPEAMAKQAVSGGPDADPARGERLSLVNPVTGLANDYLNVFNEILLLLEFLPTMPEMTEEALAWRPRSYCEYFAQSSIPGARDALLAYDKVDPDVREDFEAVLSCLAEIASRAQRKVAAESRRPEFPDSVARSCEEDAEAMRVCLSCVSRLINEGRTPKKGANCCAANTRVDGI
jgi:hypothetical protein